MLGELHDSIQQGGSLVLRLTFILVLDLAKDLVIARIDVLLSDGTLRLPLSNEWFHLADVLEIYFRWPPCLA